MSKKLETSAENIQNWRPSEDRVRQGKRIYASRLCERGEFDKAKEYCATNGLEWPPYASKELAVPISTEQVAPVVDAKAAGGHAEPGDPVRGLGEVPPVPLETAPAAQAPNPKERVCEVIGFCVNKRLLRVRFPDNGEEASLLRVRKNYSFGDRFVAELFDGVVGVNPIYREVRLPI